MEKLTQKWCLVALLEDLGEGHEYDKADWPLHITFAGVHDADWKNPKMVDELLVVLASYNPFRARALKVDMLGPTKVTYIEMNEQVLKLHDDLMNFLDTHHAIFNNPEHQRDGFIAHSSVRSGQQIDEGETVEINNIALIDMFPNGDGDRRKIAKVIRLARILEG